MSTSEPARVFLAGATGVLGRHLIPRLLEAGYVVGGMTRAADRAQQLIDLGAEPIVVDVFDREALVRAVSAFQPDVIINELTDLPKDVTRIADHAELNARIRTEGTRNLIDAARASGSPKFLAQSVAWQLDDGPDARSIVYLERTVLEEGGIVLRYGQLYGPGTYHEQAPADPHVQVDIAAQRTVEAIGQPSGVIVITG